MLARSTEVRSIHWNKARSMMNDSNETETMKSVAEGILTGVTTKTWNTKIAENTIGRNDRKYILV